MIKKISFLVSGIILSLNLTYADHDGYEYARTFLDLNDTLSGVVEGDVGRWQNSPHGVVVAPDGNVWVNIYAGSGRQEILANGDTVHYKGIYVLDPVTMDHVSYSPIEILTFPDGTSDSLTAESATSGGGRGIALDADGHILSSHYTTLYKINYMTGEGVAMWLGESSLTEAAADDNGNVYVSYVLAGERPVVTLDSDLNYVGNAVDTVGRINRSIVVTGDGENMMLGSTWNGMGFSHLTSSVPGVIQHTPVDTFGVYYGVEADWHHIGSAMGADSAYVAWYEDNDYYYADTTYDTTALWVSALDLSPDEGTLLVGTLTAGWGGPLGGTNWLFDMEDLSMPYDFVGNWHDIDEDGVGVTDGPRGGFWDADGNLYLADFYSNAIYHYAYYEEEDAGFDEPFTYARTFLDLNDTLGGVVEGDIGRWQNSPHGVVVAPDGNVWVNIYAGSGRQEILANGDTVHYKGIYVLDPVTMDHVSYSPIEILTFPDGTSDSLTAESATSGGGRGIALDADGHILSSHYTTLYKINYMTGEGVAMWLGESSLTEAAADDNGNVYVSYVLAGERPVVTLDSDLNYVGNAVDTVGRINRSIVVTGDGENMMLGSTWNGMGFSHLTSSVPGVIQHTPVDTFGVYYDVDASMTMINSAMGAESAYVLHMDDAAPDTTYEEYALWVSALDLSPDESVLVVGTLTAGWGGPLGGANWLFDMEDLSGPSGLVGNWHNWDGSGVGVTDGPRGAAFDADGNLYLADFYSNAVYHYAYDGLTISDDKQRTVVADDYVLAQNFPNPFNPSTKIEFKIPMMEQVNISVYNLEGRLIKTLVNQVMSAGNHVVNWDGTNEIGAKVSTGMYIYQLKTNSTNLNRRMTFIK